MEKLTKEQKHQKWINTKPALVIRPLRYIADRTNTKDSEGNTVISPEFRAAFYAAYVGKGHIVQRIARGLV